MGNGELESANTCVCPITVPPPAEPQTATSTKQGHLGRETTALPTAQVSIRGLQAAPASSQTLPSHTALAPAGQVPAVPPEGLHLV